MSQVFYTEVNPNKVIEDSVVVKESHHRRRLQDLVLLSDSKKNLINQFFIKRKNYLVQLVVKDFSSKKSPRKKMARCTLSMLFGWLVSLQDVRRVRSFCHSLFGSVFGFELFVFDFNTYLYLLMKTPKFCPVQVLWRVCIWKISSIQLNLTCWKDSWPPWVLLNFVNTKPACLPPRIWPTRVKKD